MFAEYLNDHPMRSLLAERPQLGVPTAADRAAWDALPDKLRAEIESLCAAYRELPYPLRTAAGFLSFVRDGSRKDDEEPYFLRRRKLCAAVLACCLDAGAPLDDVINGLWCICEETSWVISAHNVNPIPGAPSPKEYPLPDPDRPYVDLFSAQTSMILALTRYLLQERLDAVSPLLCRRIEREIQHRVLTPFMETDDFWWMGFRRKDLCNWTPWILSNVMLSACLLIPDRTALSALLDRGCRMLDRWLDVVPADGGCDEGAGYWNMAGGALLDCLQLLEIVTDGKMTFWQDEKARNILRFPLAAEIGGGWFLNFADCDARPQLSGERLQYAGERLCDPALFALGCRHRGSPADQISDTPHFIRLLRMLFHDPAPSDAPGGKDDTWLPDLQVRVVRRGGMTLCCKGGHNGESHNHNDVGSFMLYVDDQPEIVDAGNMVYTAKTFSDQRYTLWNVRAAYHNLPMIGNHEQQPGREYAADGVQCLPDGLALDMSKAYAADAAVDMLKRELRLTEDGLALHDQIQLAKIMPVTWVLMLRHAPSLDAGSIKAGAIELEYPPMLSPAAEEIPVEDPRMARSFPGSLWRVTLTAAADTAFDITIKARRNNPHA